MQNLVWSTLLLEPLRNDKNHTDLVNSGKMRGERRRKRVSLPLTAYTLSGSPGGLVHIPCLQCQRLNWGQTSWILPSSYTTRIADEFGQIFPMQCSRNPCRSSRVWGVDGGTPFDTSVFQNPIIPFGQRGGSTSLGGSVSQSTPAIKESLATARVFRTVANLRRWHNRFV